MKEIWKEITGFDGIYLVSNLGVVKSTNHKTLGRWNKYKISNGKIIKPFTSNCGYLRVCLSKDGKTKNYSVHRLVAQEFIKNIDNKKCVNHIDGNRENNNLKNLEWCNHKENTKNGVDRGSINFPTYKHKIIRIDYCKNGHPLTEENIYLRNGKYKICRQCQREWIKNYRFKLRQSLNKLKEEVEK